MLVGVVSKECVLYVTIMMGLLNDFMISGLDAGKHVREREEGSYHNIASNDTCTVASKITFTFKAHSEIALYRHQVVQKSARGII